MFEQYCLSPAGLFDFFPPLQFSSLKDIASNDRVSRHPRERSYAWDELRLHTYKKCSTLLLILCWPYSVHPHREAAPGIKWYRLQSNDTKQTIFICIGHIIKRILCCLLLFALFSACGSINWNWHFCIRGAVTFTKWGKPYCWLWNIVVE